MTPRRLVDWPFIKKKEMTGDSVGFGPPRYRRPHTQIHAKHPKKAPHTISKGHLRRSDALKKENEFLFFAQE